MVTHRQIEMFQGERHGPIVGETGKESCDTSGSDGAVGQLEVSE